MKIIITRTIVKTIHSGNTQGVVFDDTLPDYEWRQVKIDGLLYDVEPIYLSSGGMLADALSIKTANDLTGKLVTFV